MGDESGPGFEAFFRDEYVLTIAYLRKAGFAFHVADEATSQAMTLAYANWGAITTSPRGWVRTAARRLAVKLATAQRTRVADLVGRGYGTQVDDGTSPYHGVDDNDLLPRMMSRLPEKQRTVMSLHLEGFTVDEIAIQAGMRRSTVRSNLRHARESLKSIITDPRHSGETR